LNHQQSQAFIYKNQLNAQVTHLVGVTQTGLSKNTDNEWL